MKKKNEKEIRNKEVKTQSKNAVITKHNKTKKTVRLQKKGKQLKQSEIVNVWDSIPNEV